MPTKTSATGQPGWSTLPAAQWQTLVNLQAQNKLSGVPASVLAAMFQAEGANTTGAVNSAGYGGYFGLPASYTTQSFSDQAQTAAGIYSVGLAAANGSTTGAEAYYQTGSPTGSSTGPGVFKSYIDNGTLPAKLSGWSNSPNAPQTSTAVALSGGTAKPSLMGDCTLYKSPSNTTSANSKPKPGCMFGNSLTGCILTPCQTKGLISGAALFLGGVLMLAGVALLFESGRNAVGNAAQVATNFVPGGTAVQSVVRRVGTRGSVPKESHADQQRRAGAEYAAAQEKGRRAAQRRPVGKSVPAEEEF